MYLTEEPFRLKIRPATITTHLRFSLQQLPKKDITFKGWYTDSAFKNKITKIKKGTRKNYKLYAKWKINTYNIVFDGNGATSGSMKSISSCKYNTSYKLSANTFQRNGYKFIGWSTKADGSDTFYGDGATVSNLSLTNGATVNYMHSGKLCRMTKMNFI